MPEGPSILITAEELRPLIGRKVLKVEGNSKQPIARMAGGKIHDIFSYGKYLNFQFDDFALRIHFMLFGSFRLDEARPLRHPRLVLYVRGHSAYFYACSVRFVESADLRSEYDFRTDLMSEQWDRRHVLKLLRALPPETTLDDVLMDQAIFTGLGNIMKNETLWCLRLLPTRRLSDLTGRQRGRLVDEARAYAFQFYEWKKAYMLRKNYQIYRKGKCPRGCETKIVHEKTGRRQRMSHYCPVCQS